MNFENESSQNGPTNSQPSGQSFLGGLVQTIADDSISYGSGYLEQQVNQLTAKM